MASRLFVIMCTDDTGLSHDICSNHLIQLIFKPVKSLSYGAVEGIMGLIH
jgi:hypothetical protein